MSEKISTILKRNQLSLTASRERILGLFLQHSGALSHSDIEKSEGERFDRVTVYRTLQTFAEKGIIHSIPTVDNSVLYALCKEECSTTGHHHDHHIHFICNECGKTFCLDTVAPPQIKLPTGYTLSQLDVVAEGVCKNCQ